MKSWPEAKALRAANLTSQKSELHLVRYLGSQKRMEIWFVWKICMSKHCEATWRDVVKQETAGPGRTPRYPSHRELIPSGSKVFFIVLLFRFVFDPSGWSVSSETWRRKRSKHRTFWGKWRFIYLHRGSKDVLGAPLLLPIELPRCRESNTGLQLGGSSPKSCQTPPCRAKSGLPLNLSRHSKVRGSRI